MREPEFDIEMAVPSIRGAGLGLLRYRFTLFRLLMAIFLIGIILPAFLVQTRPVGQAPKIACSLFFALPANVPRSQNSMTSIVVVAVIQLEPSVLLILRPLNRW